MSRPSLDLTLILSITLLSACTTLKPEVNKTAAADNPVRALVIPAACRSTDGTCEAIDASGIEGIVRNELEFSGYSIVDASTLVHGIRERSDLNAEVKSLGVELATVKADFKKGALFEDLSPEAKRALMKEANVDAILWINVDIGARWGVGPQRKNLVQIRLDGDDKGTMLWTSRCQATSGFNPGVIESVNNAAKCAVLGALDKPVELTEPMF